MQANPNVQIGSLIVSVISFLIAALSLYISRKSWLQANRPIVTVRVTTFGGGERGTALNIVVENTGNRPAKNVSLTINEAVLEKLFVEKVDDTWRRAVKKIFSGRGVIPVLGNGKSVSNSFGYLSGGSAESAWKDEARCDITVSYEDLDGRSYTSINPILIADDEGFAGNFWKNAK